MLIHITHRNGSHPLLVCINSKNKTFDVWIEANELKSSSSFSNNMYQKKLVSDIKYNNVWIGDEIKYYKDTKWLVKKDPLAIGNSILFQIGNNKYIFTGESVVRFITNTPIENFQSIIGNNDIPNPFAISNDEVFLFIENFIKFPKTVFRKQDLKDPVSSYYSRKI